MVARHRRGRLVPPIALLMLSQSAEGSGGDLSRAQDSWAGRWGSREATLLCLSHPRCFPWSQVVLQTAVTMIVMAASLDKPSMAERIKASRMLRKSCLPPFPDS